MSGPGGGPCAKRPGGKRLHHQQAALDFESGDPHVRRQLVPELRRVLDLQAVHDGCCLRGALFIVRGPAKVGGGQEAGALSFDLEVLIDRPYFGCWLQRVDAGLQRCAARGLDLPSFAFELDVDAFRLQLKDALAVDHGRRLVVVQGPLFDDAAAMAEQLQAAVHCVRQANGQTLDQREETHDAAGLLVMVAEPAFPLLVEGICAERLVVLV